MASMMKVKHRENIYDTKFKLPNTNNHAKRILESSEQIARDAAIQFKLKNREQLDDHYAPHYLRLLDHFVELGIERTIEFMDGVDKLKADGEAIIKAAQEKNIEESIIDYGLLDHQYQLDKLSKKPIEEFMLHN